MRYSKFIKLSIEIICILLISFLSNNAATPKDSNPKPEATITNINNINVHININVDVKPDDVKAKTKAAK